MMKKALILAMMIGVVASLSVASQEALGLDWTPGRYWTYQTIAVGGGDGIRTEGTLTFLVLAGDGCSPSLTWFLAIITEWYDGTEIITTSSHSDRLTPSPWRRWPQIVNYIPPKHLPDFLIRFRQAVGSQGLPWWYEEEKSLGIQMLRDDGYSESIALMELADDQITAPGYAFDDAVAVEYEWIGRFEGTRHESTEGLAWWSPEVGWWVRAEGQERSYGSLARSFEVVLTDWGTLSAEDMAERLEGALTSTAAIDPEYGDGLRGVLERWGIDLTTD